MSGLFDLGPMALAPFLQPDLRLTPEQVVRNSPLNFVTRNPVPLILSVGENETAEFHRQSAVYAKAWRAAGNAVEEIAVPGRHHYSIIESLFDDGDPLRMALLRQMNLIG
jgi:arylformamidase